MSSLTFQALIDSIHYDSKKGAVKIVLIGASHISLDELTTLGPKEETIQVTFESAQTKISDAGDPTDEQGAAWLEEAAEKLKETEESDGEGGGE